MAPRFVAPCRQGDKNDGIDTEAICETVSHPGTRFVPVKNVIQGVRVEWHLLKLLRMTIFQNFLPRKHSRFRE